MSEAPSLTEFVWHDCLTLDIDRTVEFFLGLLDWQVQDQTSPTVGRYPILSNPQGPLAGMLAMPPMLQAAGVPPYWTGYVHCVVANATAQIVALGGHVFTAPTRSAMGTSCVFTDAGGAVLAAFEPSPAFRIPPRCQTNDVVWQRLYSNDHPRSVAFYKTLLNWRFSAAAGSGARLRTQAGALLGDLGAAATWVPVDTWVYFIAVADLEALTQGVENSGGEIVESTQIADRPAVVVKDPQGGVIGFVEGQLAAVDCGG